MRMYNSTLLNERIIKDQLGDLSIESELGLRKVVEILIIRGFKTDPNGDHGLAGTLEIEKGSSFGSYLFTQEFEENDHDDYYDNHLNYKRYIG